MFASAGGKTVLSSAFCAAPFAATVRAVRNADRCLRGMRPSQVYERMHGRLERSWHDIRAQRVSRSHSRPVRESTGNRAESAAEGAQVGGRDGVHEVLSDQAQVVRRGPAQGFQAHPGEAGADATLYLLADGGHTNGALGANRLRLGKDVDGALPHYHERSAEAFYVLEGRLLMMVDEELVTVDAGIDRFDYFRMLPAIMRNEVSELDLARAHDLYDVHFVPSPRWSTR